METSYSEGSLTPYAVINERLIRQCIKIEMIPLFDDEQSENVIRRKRRDIQFHEVEWLEMSFQNIYKISNMQGFDSLKVLQLDNNNISIIENLNHLKNLERLDLSFNHITTIENLDGLSNLRVLSFFHNKISKIQNMETLINLSNFSIAHNNITDTKDIEYLRQFRELRALTISDNPVCEERNFRYLVLAYLSDLRFLDYRLISQEERKAAIPYYHDQILKMQDIKEKEDKEQSERNRQLQEDLELERLNLVSIDELLDNMFRNEPEDANFQLFSYVLKEILETFREQFLERVLVFKDATRQRFENKEELTRELDEKKARSIDHSNDVCRRLIRSFDKKVKHARRRIRHELAPVEAFQVLETLEKELNQLSDKLIEFEVDQADSFNEMIDQFKTNYRELEGSELITSFFRDIRDLESKFIESVKQILEEENEEYRRDSRYMKIDRERLDLVRPFLDEKDQMHALIKKCHEAHSEVIGIKEEELLKRERVRMRDALKKSSTEEHRRNRERITEINMYVSMHKDAFSKEREQIEKGEYGEGE